MKSIHLVASTILAITTCAIHARADDDAVAPMVTATMKSYDDFAGMITTVAKAGDPKGKENPLGEMETMLKAHPDAIDRNGTIHAALWLNGMFEPLVAVYVPTKKFGALRKMVDALPENDELSLEKMDGYGLFLTGTDTSLEANLAAARSLDPSTFKTESSAEFTVQFDAPTRTMLNGVLAMGRLQLKQSGEQFGDEATADMMKGVFDMYFDMFDGFVEGMEQTTFTLNIVDKGIRFGIRSSAKKGTTYAKLIAKSPMAPGPIADNYSDENPIGIAGRIAEIDETLASAFGEMAALGSKITGGFDDDILEKTTTMMKDMTPMYFSFGYDLDEEITAAGVYHFGEDKDVAALYKQMLDIGIETGNQTAGEGKMYRDFKHEQVTKKGTEIDRFTYKMGDAFPPSPLMGDSMEMEYAQSGDRIYFAMGDGGVLPLLERREPTAIPAFLKPDKHTVMIGHLDVLSLIGTFAQLEVSNPLEPSVFIADNKKTKNTEKNAPAAGGEGNAAPGSKILMRASLDGTFNFDLHVPLSLIRTLARLN